MSKTIAMKFPTDWRMWPIRFVKNPVVFFNIATDSFEGEVMEKYGVELDPNQPKTASDRQHCPLCGQELEKVDNVYILKCPSHGTEPFEARP